MLDNPHRKKKESMLEIRTCTHVDGENVVKSVRYKSAKGPQKRSVRIIYRCGHCKRNFGNRKYNIFRHLPRCQDEEGKPPKKQVDPKDLVRVNKYQCPLCPSKYWKETYLEVHMESAHNWRDTKRRLEAQRLEESIGNLLDKVKESALNKTQLDLSQELQDILETQTKSIEVSDLAKIRTDTKTGPEMTRKDILSKLKGKFLQKQVLKARITKPVTAVDNQNRKSVIACNPNFDQRENAVIFCTDRIDLS